MNKKKERKYFSDDASASVGHVLGNATTAFGPEGAGRSSSEGPNGGGGFSLQR